jgi:5-formyltetrahydrofolate cyclo-ligase
MESLLNDKIFLRCALKKIRAEILLSRREEAKLGLLRLLSQLIPFKNILSFSSFESEIDTSLINFFLARTQRLLLPKIIGNELEIFKVDAPESQLLPHSFGMLEPNSKVCATIEACHVEVVLVPALGFDHKNHRLGYGRGFYDRFLKRVPHALTLGIGFHEQFLPDLPAFPTDIPLNKVCLF